MPTIRPLEPDELDIFVDDCWLPFRESSAELDEYSELEETGVREEGLEYRRRSLDAEGQATFVVDDNGELVGYLSVRHMEVPPGHARGDSVLITELYIHPERRGAGIASDLHDRAEVWADERDCTHLMLFVHPDNEPARSIYRKWGFDLKREMLVRPLESRDCS